ncbi:SdpI family protein [Chryseobacterium sp. KACC 21268]|nr:SdpI family protein [Chryseobacterium sp. KACC 21268]
MVDNSTSVPILVGAVFLFAGILMFVFPPKKINYLYGYRTSSSMKNIDRWNFAQKLSSRIMMIGGVILIVTGILGLLFFKSEEVIINTIGIVETILLTIILLLKTELDLKKKFGKNL